ncbi:MAG TPA: tetratricopeptide repeat protein, partial [bacterium]|nr:tetratricopeptide repeat protein [bacterium]
DQGHTFDPNQAKDPDLQRYVDIGKKGGLGIFIIRRVIDEIDYRKTPEGNELRLTKNRETESGRKLLVPELSLTMKNRFSLIASAILTFLAVIGITYNYIRQEKVILNESFDMGRALARSMASSILDPLTNDEMWELTKIASTLQRNQDPFIVEAIVADTSGTIKGAVTTEYLFQQYRRPSDAVLFFPSVWKYTIPATEETVYDLTEPVVHEVSGRANRLGQIHLLLSKNYIDGNIRQARHRTMGIGIVVLVIGYLGVFILVYVTMSPFKKLSRWVRDLGRGESQDEMEFNASDEVGEIAQAFNEITEKFRKSQENLAEQERLQKEMQVAQEIQHTLLPAVFPEIEGYEIASYYEAAKEVGGDYFDFVEVDKDTLGIVVADVSGKGVPGSLVMTMIRTALRTEARGNKNAADVLARVNDFVINDMKRGMFVTVFYLILDSQNRTINYASAGHNPMILFRGQTRKSYYLNPRGFPIGINLPDRTLFRKSIQSDNLWLREGDVLILYTDGITEAMDPKRERYGDERFLESIRRHGELKVDPLVDKLQDEIKDFTQGFAQSDDITLMAIREKLKAEDVMYNRRLRLIGLVNEEGKSVKEACEIIGVSTSTYYKYKKRYDKQGIEGLKETTQRSDLEEKHTSIEDKARILDIIKNNPEFGAKRISEELNSEKYGYVKMDERRIYDELKRSRLNTRELRMNFIERGGKAKRIKTPGTPMLTMDGKVIIDGSPAGEPDSVSDDFPQSKVLRISQRSSRQKDEGRKEDTDVLDRFLGLPGQAEDLETDYKETEKEEKETPEDGKTVSETADGRIMQEDVLREDEIDFEMESPESLIEDSVQQEESVLNEIITDVLDLNGESSFEEELVGTQERVPSMDELLNEEVDSEHEENEIEDHITASIVGDLISEEMGVEENTTLSVSDQEEDGFIDVMEELGFDRRNMLSTGKTPRREKPSPAIIHQRKTHFLNRGLVLYRAGDYQAAVDAFQKAVKEDPEFADAFQCLGDTYFRMGRMEEARDAYERVRHLDPGNVSVLENLGVIFANRGDYKKAVWQWGEVLKRNPERRDIIERIKKMQRVIRQQYL